MENPGGLTDEQIRELLTYMQRRATSDTGPVPEASLATIATPEAPPEEEEELEAPYSAQPSGRRAVFRDQGSRSLIAVLQLLERLRSQTDPTLPEQDNEEYLRRMLDHYMRQAGLSRALTSQRLLRGGPGSE